MAHSSYSGYTGMRLHWKARVKLVLCVADAKDNRLHDTCIPWLFPLLLWQS